MRELFGLREDAAGAEQPAGASSREVHDLPARRRASADAARHPAQRARARAGRARRRALSGRAGLRARRRSSPAATAARAAQRQVALGRRARAGAAATGEIDLAVHSAKDVPGRARRRARAARRPARARRRGRALRRRAASTSCAPGARVGTSSVRRAGPAARRARGPRGGRAARQRRHAPAQARRRASGCDAIVLARAGLQRLGREAERRRACSTRRASCRRPGRARSRSRGAPRTSALREAAAARSPTPATFACLLAERALARALGAELPHAARRAARVPTATDGAAAARLGRAARRLGVGARRAAPATRDEPEALGRARRRAAARAPAPASCCDAREEMASVGDAPEAARAGACTSSAPGPGDPGLLTARALELIARADVILYDRLIPAAALDGARAGRRAACSSARRAAASRCRRSRPRRCWSSARARAATVVRLKGGDPFVFGRGGEEALALRAAGIPFEVVPGRHRRRRRAAPTRASPSPTAGSPARSRSSPATRTRARTRSALDWPALAAFPGTLVFYMGVRRLPQIAARADRRRARPRDEPAAVVEGGHAARPAHRPRARSRRSPRRPRARRSRAPSITVVGAGRARSPSELAWLPPRPLAGRTVAVTRARAQASELARRLRALGARVVEAPVIRIRAARPAPPLDPRRYDLVCLTSPNGVAALFERLAAGGPRRARAGRRARRRDRPGHRARRWPSTASRADVVPERFVAEALVEALADVPVSARAVARARDARDVLPDALRARGAEVEVLALYETVAEPLAARDARGGARRPTTSPSPPPRPCASSSRPPAARPRLAPRHADRLDRPGHQRRRCASTASSRTSRPSATTSTA